VLNCQIQIAGDTAAVASAFSNIGDPTYGPFYQLWNWVSYDVGERHIEPLKTPLDPKVWHERTKSMLEQIALKTRKSTLGNKWVGFEVLVWSAMGLCTFGPMVLWMLIFTTYYQVTTPAGTGVHHADPMENSDTTDLTPPLTKKVFGGGALVLLVGGVFFSLLWILPKSAPYRIKMAERGYRELWQQEIFNFLALSRLPYGHLMNFISMETKQHMYAGWAFGEAQQDVALPVFAIAQQFVL
jgi:hypothetical protein